MNQKIKKISIIIIVAIVLIISSFYIFGSNGIEYIQYREFFEKVESGEISNVIIEDNKVNFAIKNDSKKYYTDNPNYDGFKEKLLLNDVEVSEVSAEDSIYFVFDILIYVGFFGVIVFVVSKFVLSTRETFKVVHHTKVKFDDIAGMDNLKRDMMKIVEVLKNPESYKNKGIRQLKGIIFEGTPGNGKTLFAKALAEEANVNFIATRGADFQSAMMSVGASKIKMLFKKARRNRPCIIFIDEFDSIGERRYYAGTGVDKENNRIVTAMLNEMDGFKSEDGILVIAATNSFNSLDSALIRPGRFDLKYNISNPDLNTRKKLIELYTKNKELADDIKKDKLAEAFEGLSCSAVETVLNEASMIALLENKEKISLDNIIEAGKKTNCKVNL